MAYLKGQSQLSLTIPRGYGFLFLNKKSYLRKPLIISVGQPLKKEADLNKCGNQQNI